MVRFLGKYTRDFCRIFGRKNYCEIDKKYDYDVVKMREVTSKIIIALKNDLFSKLFILDYLKIPNTKNYLMLSI